jgi:hypothetical protein
MRNSTPLAITSRGIMRRRDMRATPRPSIAARATEVRVAITPAMVRAPAPVAIAAARTTPGGTRAAEGTAKADAAEAVTASRRVATRQAITPVITIPETFISRFKWFFLQQARRWTTRDDRLDLRESL